MTASIQDRRFKEFIEDHHWDDHANYHSSGMATKWPLAKAVILTNS
ncbi:hypothetical protein [Pseudomonas gingeri]|uniref:Uncharacterized protein n=1 Tax=Pseudomonas gingeri TaxID=117681 RepID=A0A7Y7XW10_9PSED|nr:hypothetical protein [Pseudomonas gingeri]NWC13025.1 hypothetical protein [Pseudomonas gingeri]